jgi:enamine deaminase RidA (YjgF/YER057c/UK114 family)
MNIQILQPEGWAPSKGYSNGIATAGRLIFVAGQVGTDRQMNLVGPDFIQQARQALENVVAVLKEGGATPAHLTRLTWYVTDMNAYLSNLKELGQVYRAVIGNHYPAMTLVGVTALVFTDAKLEIEATAVIPHER